MADNSTIDPWDAISTPAPAPATAPTAQADPWDAVSTPAPAPTAQADPWDAVSAPATSVVPPLSDQEFQQKMNTRWGAMLNGDSMASPTDLAEMSATGKFTPEQLQRVQTETALRQEYINQQAHPFANLGSTVGNLAQDVTVLPRVWQAYKDISANPTGYVNDAERVASGITEGFSDAVTGAGGMIAAPFRYAYNKVAGTPPLTPEQQYQAWKLDYLTTHPTPGYASHTTSRVQDAMASLTGDPAESFATPSAPAQQLASTAASIPLFEGAAGLAGAVVPAALKAAGAAEIASKYAPTLANIGDTAGAQAAKIRNAMNETVSPGSTPLLAKDVTAPIAKAATDAGNWAADKAGNAVSAVGNTATGLADRINAIPGISSDFGKYLLSSVITPMGAFAVSSVLKALEKLGPKATNVGDFASRVASSSPDDAFGRFAALASDASAPDWMARVAQNPAIKLATKAATVAGGAAKGTLEGAATGAALGTVSGDSPEDTLENAVNFGAFGALHGSMSAQQGKVFDAQIPAVTKFITDSLIAGTSPETLRIVPASDILQASLMHNAQPNLSIRFATPLDADSPFGPNGVAKDQAGLDDPANNTYWIDPTKRAPGSTLLHEAFHPIYRKLVAEQPNIKATIDSALARNGSSLDEFKQQYANRVYPNDPQAAADYIKSQDTTNPDWAYSEMLSESAAHNLDGKDLLSAMQGQDVQQSTTQAALAGVSGWLNDMGVALQKTQETGTIFPDFKNSFNDPGLRKLTYKLLKAQRDSLSRKPTEAPETPLTENDMGGKKAPMFDVGGRKVNPYGEMVPDPKSKSGFRFVKASAAEVKRRGEAEQAALQKYFPEVDKGVTTMPAGLIDDPNITPWTKQSLQDTFDAIKNRNKLSFWYHRMSDENSATAEASALKKDGNARVSYQEMNPIDVRRTRKNNLLTRAHSEAAENQKIEAWSGKRGPISLDLWGGDKAKVKDDIQTYLENHATGQPGEANGIGIDKKNVLDVLLSGVGSRDFESANPLRKLLKKADRNGVIRDFRPDRQESIASEPSGRAPLDWEKAKRNMSPAAETDEKQGELSGTFSPSAKRDIELTGPDGKKYPAEYGGIQETLDPKAPWLTITPKVDLPGATTAKSTTYAHTLAKKGYTVPPELYKELENHAAPGQQQFSPAASQTPYDSLPNETKADIEHHLSDSGISGLDEDDTKSNLRNLAEEPLVTTGKISAQAIEMSKERQVSPVAVRKYAARFKAGENAPPIVVEKIATGLKLLEGGNRLAAAKKAGVDIDYADISALKSADWGKWVNGEQGHNMPTTQPRFSPTPDPNGIAAAARRDKQTGRIFAGENHRSAGAKSPKAGEDLEDGFVTNSGEFLTRDQAFKRAVDAQQYKPSDEDYNVNKILYGLTSERFNKQNPSAGFSGVKAAEEALSKVQSTDLRPGVQPAIRWKGKIYTQAQLAKMRGSSAIDKLEKKGVLKESDWVEEDYDNPGKRGGYIIEHGFSDKNGKWVNEKNAYKPIKQRPSYSPAVEAKNVRQPDEDIRKQAADYTAQAELSHSPFTGYAPLNEDLGKRVADAYEAAPHIPDDPKVLAAYKALANETRAQWDYLTKKGIKFEPWTKEGQPYQSSAEMRADVQQNKHLWFFPTQQGFGEGEAKTNNPMLQDTGHVVKGVPLAVNDMFRAVHDYFGHAKEGYEFGPRGEYNAYLAHSRMFSDAALPALTAETMGQNSWVNFGKHLRNEQGEVPKKGEEGYVSPQDRPFAEQKATVLPDDLMKESLDSNRPRPNVSFSPSAKNEGDVEKALKAGAGAVRRQYNIEGAPFKIGEAVTVARAADDEIDEDTVGKHGVIEHYEYNCGSGQAFPHDPMIGVRLSDGKLHEFWREELESTKSTNRQQFSPRGGDFPAQFRDINEQRREDDLPPDVIDFLKQEIGTAKIRLSDARKVRQGFKPTTGTLKSIFAPDGKLTLDKAAQALEPYGITGDEDLFERIERAAAAREKLWDEHVKNTAPRKPFDQLEYEKAQALPFSPAAQHPATLTRQEMAKWLLDNKAWDSIGALDAKAARAIARKGKSWMLTTLPTDYFDHAPAGDSHAAPGQPIVAHYTKDGWQALDGQHRVSAALAAGVESLPAYIPVEHKAESFSPAAKEGNTDPLYYSKLKNVVDEKFSGESMPAAQLAAVLRNPNSGIKADEMKWSGINDFLKGKHRVSKEEVQNFLDNQDMTPRFRKLPQRGFGLPALAAPPVQPQNQPQS